MHANHHRRSGQPSAGDDRGERRDRPQVPHPRDHLAADRRHRIDATIEITWTNRDTRCRALGKTVGPLTAGHGARRRTRSKKQHEPVPSEGVAPDASIRLRSRVRPRPVAHQCITPLLYRRDDRSTAGPARCEPGRPCDPKPRTGSALARKPIYSSSTCSRRRLRAGSGSGQPSRSPPTRSRQTVTGSHSTPE